jgi:methionyl-tRNA formyltransferase
MNNTKFAFFGTSEISVIVLNELKAKGFLPTLIVTVPDKPKGRRMVLTAPETKVWAEENKIPFIQLKTLREPESEEMIKSFSENGFDLFIVASYGKIIPQNILDIPRYGSLNVHPSLLPKLRGPSPIISAILGEDETGVTIMKVDAEMDHGPILAQKKIPKDMIAEWPPYEKELEEIAGKMGGEMLAEIIPDWIEGKIQEKEQDHNLATLCVKIQKSDGEIKLSDDPHKNLRKIRGFHVWPTAYFFTGSGDKKIRVIVKKAHIEDGKLMLDRVVPEGRKEMSYEDFLNGKNSKNS